MKGFAAPLYPGRSLADARRPANLPGAALPSAGNNQSYWLEPTGKGSECRLTVSAAPKKGELFE